MGSATENSSSKALISQEGPHTGPKAHPPFCRNTPRTPISLHMNKISTPASRWWLSVSLMSFERLNLPAEVSMLDLHFQQTVEAGDVGKGGADR